MRKYFLVKFIEYELTDLVRESARECRLKVLRYVMTESQIYSRPAYSNSVNFTI